MGKGTIPVVLGHVRGGVPKDVANDAHRWLGRVDEGVAHHKLFENIVLDSALEEVLLHALLFRCSYIPEKLERVKEEELNFQVHLSTKQKGHGQLGNLKDHQPEVQFYGPSAYLFPYPC